MHLHCPHCKNPIELVGAAPQGEAVCPSCGSTIRLDGDAATLTLPRLERVGRFHILAQVGQGAFGTVFRARDPELDRIVAIKVPRAGNLAGPQELDLFLREARSVAQLRHDGIVAIFEVGRAGEIPFLVSEFIDGVTLADVLSARKYGARHAAALLAQVADALQYAHDQGIVHRDVKPSNLMIVRDASTEGSGESPLSASVKVMDFGLAKRDAAEITMTMEGQIIGTPAYMSPEQARGDVSLVDGRSDEYSLGVILYQALTGELPFRGTTRMLLHQVLHEEPRSPRVLNEGIPRDLETITLKAMAKEPKGRYPRVADFAADLRRFLAGEPIQARPVGKLHRGWRWCRRNPQLASLTAALLFVLLAGMSLVTWKWLEADANLDVANANFLEKTRQEGIAQRELKRSEGLHKQAEEYLLQARERAYASDMTLAFQNWSTGQVGRAEELLAAQRPLAGQKDLRELEWFLLWKLARGEKWKIAAKATSRIGIAFSPDGTQLATAAGTDRLVHFWDAKTGAKIKSLSGFKRPVGSLAFSPDGKWLAAGGIVTANPKMQSGELKLFDLRTGAERTLHFSDVMTEQVFTLAFSPDSSMLASGHYAKDVRIWDPLSGKEVAHVRPDGRGNDASSPWTLSIGFSADSRRLVTSDNQGETRVWDISKGLGKLQSKVLFSVRSAANSRNAAAFSPRGDVLATFGRERNAVNLWDGRTGDPLGSIHANTEESVYQALCFSTDGMTLAVARGSETQMSDVTLWDVPSRTRLATFRGHAGCFSVAISPDGTSLAAGDGSGDVRVYDITGLQKRSPPQMHAHAINCLAVSSGGKNAASAGTDGTIRLWNIETGMQQAVLPGHAGPVLGIAFCSRTGLLASTGMDKRVCVWDPEKKKLLRTLPLENTGHSVAFSPTDGLLAVASGKSILLWEAQGKRALPELGPMTGNVWSVAFSGDGKRLGSGGADKAVRIWDVAGRKHISEITVPEVVWSVAISPDGKAVAAGGKGNDVRVWDADTVKELARFSNPASAPSFASVAFHPDGEVLAATAHDGSATVWDWRKGAELAKFHGHEGLLQGIAFTTDGDALLTAGQDRHIQIWDLARKAPRRAMGQYEVASLAYSRDGDMLAVGGNRVFKLIDFASGTERVFREGFTGSVLAALTPDGATAATVEHIPDQLHMREPPRAVKLWDVATGALKATLPGHSTGIFAIAFSPDGKWLATGGGTRLARPGELKIWDVAICKELAGFSVHTDPIRALAFSPDGKTLASACATVWSNISSEIKVWDVPSFKERRNIPCPETGVTSLAFSPDGSLLAAGCMNNAIRLWDPTNGATLGTLEGHRWAIHSVAFSRGSRRLVSIAGDNSVRFWDTKFGRCIADFPFPRNHLSALALSPDGGMLALGSAAAYEGEALRLFPIAPTMEADSPLPRRASK